MMVLSTTSRRNISRAEVLWGYTLDLVDRGSLTDTQNMIGVRSPQEYCAEDVSNGRLTPLNFPGREMKFL